MSKILRIFTDTLDWYKIRFDILTLFYPFIPLFSGELICYHKSLLVLVMSILRLLNKNTIAGRTLQEGGKYFMGRHVVKDKVEVILHIRDSSKLDFGEYACRADN